MEQVIPYLLTSSPTGIELAVWLYSAVPPRRAAHIDLALMEDRLQKALVDKASGYGKG